MDWEVKVRHSYREADSCTDTLANIGYSMRFILMTYESCPTQIRHLLVVDQIGVSHPRMIKL